MYKYEVADTNLFKKFEIRLSSLLELFVVRRAYKGFEHDTNRLVNESQFSRNIGQTLPHFRVFLVALCDPSVGALGRGLAVDVSVNAIIVVVKAPLGGLVLVEDDDDDQFTI